MKKIFIALLLFFVVLYILPLGMRPAIIPDELRYAEIPREMIASGDWVVPRLDGFRYFEKPVMGHWLNAVSMKIFGENDFAMRFPSAVAAGLSMLIIFIAARRFLNNSTALLAALIFMTSQMVFCIGTFNVTDTMLAAFLNLCIFTFFFAYSEEKIHKRFLFLALSGVFAGCAFLTKGFLAFAVPCLAIVPFLLWQKQWRRIFTMPWIPLVFVLLVSIPWCILIHLRESDFWNYFFWFEHVQRFLAGSDEFQHPEPFFYFIPVLLIGALPWTFVMPAAVAGLKKNILDVPFNRYLICWFTLSFLFFSASSGKLATYILPCFAPLSILLAQGLLKYFENGGRKMFNVGAIIFGAVSLVAAVLLVLHQIFKIPSETIFYNYETWKWIAVSVALIFTGITMIRAARRKEHISKLVLFALAPAFIMMGFHFLIPDQVKERKAPGEFLTRYAGKITDDAIIVTYKNLLHAASWYYKRNDTYVLEEKGELTYGLKFDDSKHRFLTVETLDAMIKENKGKRPVILVLRTKIYNEDCAPKLPQPSFVASYGEFTIVEYKK